MIGAYRIASGLAPPVLRVVLRRRLARGKEDAARIGERMGRASRPRPAGSLIWIHGASVGESLSALPLVARLLAARPEAHVLVTTGTVTSARLMRERLPARAIHQFVPLDAAPWVCRFLDHWRPDLALWIESELWPNLLGLAAARGVPLVLVNGRLSERSFAKWRRWPRAARRLMSAFRLVLAQSDADAARFRALGAEDVAMPGNLKFAAAPLPADDEKRAAFAAAIGARPVWIAASIHSGEDRAVAAAQALLAARMPGALAIAVPRHAEKGGAMQAAMAEAGLAVARRSAGEPCTPGTDIYLADTLGELGLFYRLASCAFVGGSLIPHGGQNPIEPALLGLPVLHGPSMANFAAVVDALTRAGGARQVADSAALGETLAALLADPSARSRMGAAARAAAEAEAGVIDRILAALSPLLVRIGAKSHASA